MSAAAKGVHSAARLPFVAARRFVHHPQHLDAAGRDEPPYQKDCEKKKPDIEPCRVVPRNRCFDDAGLTLVRNETKGTK